MKSVKKAKFKATLVFLLVLGNLNLLKAQFVFTIYADSATATTLTIIGSGTATTDNSLGIWSNGSTSQLSGNSSGATPLDFVNNNIDNKRFTLNGDLKIVAVDTAVNFGEIYLDDDGFGDDFGFRAIARATVLNNKTYTLSGSATFTLNPGQTFGDLKVGTYVDAFSSSNGGWIGFDRSKITLIITDAERLTWNGTNWTSNFGGSGVPNDDSDVILASTTSPGSFSAKNLEFNIGVDLNLDTGDTLTLKGDIKGAEGYSGKEGSLKFFSLSGTSMNWLSGAGGTFSGTGTPANSLNFFNGTHVAVPDDTIFDFSSGLTVEAWVKADALSNHASLVSKFANNQREFSLLLLSSGKIEYSITFDGSSEQYFSGNTTLVSGTWYHVALTYDGTTMRAFINGSADGTNSVNGTIHNGTSDLYMGVRSEVGIARFFDGNLDEVRLWNTARTQAQLQASMNSELTGNEAGLLTYYTFNQGIAAGSNSTVTSLLDSKLIPTNPNVISGKGLLILDNNGDTTSLNNVKLNMEGVVQVNAGTTLQTNDSLSLTTSSVTSYGQLVGDGTVLGNVVSQAYLDVSTARYHYLGSPFTNATLEEFNEGHTMLAANSSQGTVWQWDANTAAWEAPSALTNVAANGRGYALFAGTNSFGSFLLNSSGSSELDGTVATGDVSVAMGYNNGQSGGGSFAGGGGQTATEGWNFLANPYPSQYDWNGQSLPAGMNNAFYVNIGGSFASYVGGVGINGGTQYLAPFQGFWVQTTNASSGNFTFEQDQRVTAPSTALMKMARLDGVYLSLNKSTCMDQLYVGFELQATNNFDRRWDARKLRNENGAPNMYASLNGEDYSICRVPLRGFKSFPIMLDYMEANDSLTMSLDNSQLSSFAKVELEDLKTDLRHDFINGDYMFINDTAFWGNRFVLHFSQNTVGLEEKANTIEFTPYAYADNDRINVQLGNMGFSDVSVFNLAGQQIFETKRSQGLQTLPQMKAGVYIIKVNQERTSHSIKVISK